MSYHVELFLFVISFGEALGMKYFDYCFFLFLISRDCERSVVINHPSREKLILTEIFIGVNIDGLCRFRNTRQYMTFSQCRNR